MVDLGYKDVVIYEVHVETFYDADDEGVAHGLAGFLAALVPSPVGGWPPLHTPAVRVCRPDVGRARSAEGQLVGMRFA